MTLDVVIPTYNRSSLLRKTLRSLTEAPISSGCSVRVLVVDNNSSDDTPEAVEEFAHIAGCPVVYLTERHGQGRSFALNTGIRYSNADFIGFIDDDEEVDASWFEVVFRAFSDQPLDYVGGPYIPRFAVPAPAWVDHPHTRTAVGWAEFSETRRSYDDENFDALLLGGNAVIRRSSLIQIGLYSTSLGRTAKRLLAGEDADMHERLMAANFRGMYLPELIVYHHIPSARLCKSYMRRWAFWASASNGVRLRINPPQGITWLGLPRHYYVNAARMPFQLFGAKLRAASPAQVFHRELVLWRFLGTFYGRHFLALK